VIDGRLLVGPTHVVRNTRACDPLKLALLVCFPELLEQGPSACFIYLRSCSFPLLFLLFVSVSFLRFFITKQKLEECYAASSILSVLCLDSDETSLPSWSERSSACTSSIVLAF